MARCPILSKCPTAGLLEAAHEAISNWEEAEDMVEFSVTRWPNQERPATAQNFRDISRDRLSRTWAELKYRYDHGELDLVEAGEVESIQTNNRTLLLPISRNPARN
jgi:hypothetical protein